MAATAVLAVNVSVAVARSSDRNWDNKPGFQTKQRAYASDEEEAQPRRRSSRNLRGAHRSRTAAAARPVRAKTPARAKRQIEARIAGAASKTDIVPLLQRSVVATHPLLPDPPLSAHGPEPAVASVPVVEMATPRCRGAHRSAFTLALASFAREVQPSEPVMLDGAWPQCRGARHPQSNWQLASLGPALPVPDPSASRSLSGGSIRWIASAGCLASPLRGMLAKVAANFGPVTVNSTCRSRSHNRRVGGASRSYHLTGNAVDFRVRSSFGAVHAFLARQRTVGGLKHYGRGVFHIDTGPRRTWGARRARHARR
jgi:hypothetical protein